MVVADADRNVAVVDSGASANVSRVEESVVARQHRPAVAAAAVEPLVAVVVVALAAAAAVA